ncbi:murein transglycosylase [Niallia endozanthoxylica]|uniref:Murein transglycosylase n=2 Tax=Niallia endozanthoxylica TaxID=2036016 RepID=A0A5J5HRT2_9BACI|nr:murein transglycosylase [Niallia endozanthoxylica]
MRKLLIGLLIIPVFFLFIIGLVLFDYIYFPLISHKAEKAAEKHLEAKYSEDFIIEQSTFSKPLGDDWGTYRIDSHPAKDPELTVRLSISEDMQPMSDDYLDMKWRKELNEQFSSIYKELYSTVENYSYMVNVSFLDEAYTQYNIHNTYQEILGQDHEGIGNIIFSNVLLNSSNEMDQQLDKAYKLIQYLQDQELKYFSIQIEYYDEKLHHELSAKEKKLNYNDFSNKFWDDRVFRFNYSYDSSDENSKKELDNIKDPADLKQYLRDLH